MLGRRLSVASSISDVSSSFWNEDDLYALTEEHLCSVHEEVKRTIKDFQDEIDLFNKFFSASKQSFPVVGKDGTVGVPASSAESSSGTPTTSSIDVGPFLEPGIRKASIGSKSKLTDREKCWLWQKELEVVKANRRDSKKTFEKEYQFYKICERIAREQKSDFTKARKRLELMANNDVITFKKRGAEKSQTDRLPIEELLKFLETLRRSYLQGEVANKRKTALLTNKLGRDSKKTSLHQNSQQSVEVMQVLLKSNAPEEKVILEKVNSELKATREQHHELYYALSNEEKEIENLIKYNQELERKIASEDFRIQELRKKIDKVNEFLQLSNKKKKSYEMFRSVQKELPTIVDYFLSDPSILKQKKILERKSIADQKRELVKLKTYKDIN